jgi:hypothetical protein
MNPLCLLQNVKPCFMAVSQNEFARADAFELHVTVAPLIGLELERFKKLCVTNRLKALQINFSSFTPVQIMTCSRFEGSLHQALLELNRVRDVLETNGFVVVRRKLEAAPWNSHVPQDSAPNNVTEYFEHHAKLLLPENANLTRLEQIANIHKAHLSSNAFKQLEQGFSQRFITRRGYQMTRAAAQGLFEELLKHLQLAGFTVQDSIAEFCVFDSHLELDGAWGS